MIQTRAAQEDNILKREHIDIIQHPRSSLEIFLIHKAFFYITFAAKYAGMDQVKFVEEGLSKILKPADHITSNFLKAVFHKFYLVHS